MDGICFAGGGWLQLPPWHCHNDPCLIPFVQQLMINSMCQKRAELIHNACTCSYLNTVCLADCSTQHTSSTGPCLPVFQYPKCVRNCEISLTWCTVPPAAVPLRETPAGCTGQQPSQQMLLLLQHHPCPEHMQRGKHRL